MKTIRRGEAGGDSRTAPFGRCCPDRPDPGRLRGDAELDTLQPQSGNARDIDTLLDRVLVIAGVIGVLVLGAVVMAKKRRAKSYDGDDEFPEQISRNNTLEIGWTIVNGVMVVVAVLTTVAHFSLNETEANAYEVEVEALHQLGAEDRRGRSAGGVPLLLHRGRRRRLPRPGLPGRHRHRWANGHPDRSRGRVARHIP